jgi:ribonuclease P protein component
MWKSSPALGLGRAGRLRNAAAIQAVFRAGQRAEGRAFVALWRPAEGGRRAGFAVSRQLREAVERNRVKRRLREAYRREQGVFPAHVDMVFVGRPVALRVPFDELMAEMRATGRTIARRCETAAGLRGARS